MILLYGPDEKLRDGARAIRERGWNVQLRSFRAFRKHNYAEEEVEKVFLMEEHTEVRKVYDEAGIPVEVCEALAPTVYTQAEVQAMPFFKKRSILKDLTGVTAKNALETDHLIRQHYEGR